MSFGRPGGGRPGGRGGRPGGGGRQRPPRRNLTVVEATHLTPQLVRVVAAGELEAWPVSAPSAHFKVFLPQDGSDELAMRTYTVRSYDPDAKQLTVDFAIHGDGPATVWALQASPGDAFQVSGEARSGYQPAEGSAWTIFIADQSALPAVAAIAETLPAGFKAKALIEVPGDAEKLELSSAADLELEWIIQSGASCAELLARALALELPAGDGEIWVGCEATAMREIRRHMLHDRGLNPRTLKTRAYWKADTVAHSDHDTGDDVD